MTNAEKKILDIIKKDPFISQQDIADELNLQRSSVAVHISNLKQKGKILGMGYIFPNVEYITVIGGANVDFIGYSKNKILKNDSNIGFIKTSLGGVGRNIAENISKLGVKTYLISPIANDDKAKLILNNADITKIDISKMVRVDDEFIGTSSYMAILDDEKDMLYAISDMEIMKYLNETEIEKRRTHIENAKYVVLDANITEEAIDYIFCKLNVNNIIVDTVSKNKTYKFLNYLDKIFLIKPNIYELEILSGISIENEEDIKKSAKIVIDKGVKHLVISRGHDGVDYYSKDKHVHFDVKKVDVVNATGAGDSFIAGICYALMNDMDIDEAILYGISAANITLKSELTVSENMTLNNLIKEKEKLGGF